MRVKGAPLQKYRFLSGMDIPFAFPSSNKNVGCIPCTINTGAWNAPYDISLLI
ncbi:MAG: hypothetical protein Q7T21_07550 [Gallionella sp.]|nr:hypothetical protein [Gallionella sp.]